jgi:rubrerythrin
MPYTIHYNKEMHLLEMKHQGKLVFGESVTLTTEMLKMAGEKNCYRVLSDYRETNLALSTLEIYKMPRVIHEAASAEGMDARRFKRALVAGKGSQSLRFFEIMSHDLGHIAKVFFNIDEARVWLLQD